MIRVPGLDISFHMILFVQYDVDNRVLRIGNNIEQPDIEPLTGIFILHYMKRTSLLHNIFCMQNHTFIRIKEISLKRLHRRAELIAIVIELNDTSGQSEVSLIVLFELRIVINRRRFICIVAVYYTESLGLLPSVSVITGFIYVEPVNRMQISLPLQQILDTPVSHFLHSTGP